MTKAILIVAGLIIVTLMIVLTCVVLQHPAMRPTVTVLFNGYTNDASGTRLGAFTGSNVGPSPVLRRSHYRILVRPATATRWSRLSDGWFSDSGSVLKAAASEKVMLPGPTNQLWRVSIYVNPETGIVRDILDWAGDLARAGPGIHKRNVNYGFQSEPIGE